MEVFTVASDAENRVDIGGKRKSFSRRSSILKASKSPLKAGVVEDLDPNSLDEGCGRAKKSRWSSGRRVSFAEKNEIKEFLVEEDWYSTSVANKDKENEIISPNRDANGEYREPADTIKGIESLLKGDIQANGGQINKAEVKEMPEVQFDKLNAAKAGQGSSVERGIVFQNVGRDQARHSSGMFVPTPTTQSQVANRHEDNASVEMDCTQCHDFTNLSHDGTGILDQDKTTVFDRDTGSDGELELTCTHQQIFFRDYPTAPLSSPVSKRPLNIENGDKVDGKSFIMSLGSKPSIDLSNQLVKHPTVLTSNGSLMQKRVPLGELNVVSNTAMKDTYDSEDTPNSPAQLDITSCHGFGILPSKLCEDHTRVFTADSDDTCALDLTLCHRQEQAFPELSSVPPQSLCNVEKKDASTFLKSLAKPSQSGPTFSREQFDQGNNQHFAPAENVYQTTQQLDQENVSAKQNSLQAPAMNGQSFLVRLLTPPKDEPETTYFGCDENLDLTVCHSNSILDSSWQQVVKRRSIYDPTNVDLTMCYGSGLVKSPKTDSASDIANGKDQTRTLHVDSGTFSSDAAVNGGIAKGIAGAANRKISLGSLVLPQTKIQCTLETHRNIDEMVQHESGPYIAEDVNQVSCGENLELTLCHSNAILDNSQDQVVKRRSIYEPTNVDLTVCYGSGFVRSPETGSATDTTERTGTLGQGTFAGDSKARVSITNVTGGAAKSKVLLGSQLLPQAKVQCNERTHNTEVVQPKSCTYSAHDVNQISCFKFNVDGTAPYRHMTSCMSSSGMQPASHKDAMELTGTIAETWRFSEWEKADGVIGQDTLNSKSSFVNEKIGMSMSGPTTTVQTCESKSEFSEVRELSALSGTTDSNNKSFPSTKEVNKTLMDQINMDKSRVGFTGGFLEAKDATPVLATNDLEFNNQSICKTEERNLSIDDQSSAHRFSGVLTERCPAPEEGTKVSHHDHVQYRGLATEEEMNVSLCQQKMLSDDVAGFDAKSKELRNVVTTTEVKDNFSFVGEQSKQDLTLSRLSPGCGGCRELSVIDEEIGSEMTRSTVTDYSSSAMAVQSLQTTIKPMTLDEFLNTAEVMFLNEEACIRRNTIIASSVEAMAARTEKEIVFSSLVHKPKTFCYEETIQSIEEEIKLVKEGLDQQREELSTTNPTIFCDIQTASKDEALDMRKKLCHLKTMCEKTAKQEWMEGQLKMNKKILATLKENHEQISSDALVTVESLGLVDDCLNLIEKMDKELEEGIKGFYLSLESGEKKLQEHMLQTNEVKKIKGLLKSHEEELTELENQRSNLQSEKGELARRKEELEGQVLEHEETVRSLKNKKPTSTSGTIKSMSQTLDILESLQEWSLEEWDSEHAKFTFLKDTLEMTVLFGTDLGDRGSMPNREIKRIQLTPCLPDGGSRYYRILHRLVFLSVNQELLIKVTSCQADLTKTLQHLSEIVFKARYTGDEIYRIGLSHLMSFKEDKLIVEFSSVKAFVKFLVEIQLDLQLYPDSVTFTCLPKIGQYSQSEIESALRAVHAGPRYLSRLVEAADLLLV